MQELPKFWKRLKVQQQYAFVSTFIFGIIAHGSGIFNKFSAHDDLRYMFTGGVTFTSGRWMLYIAEKIKNLIFQDSVYSFPTINGFFTFLCIAVSLCLLIDLFDIHSINFSILLSGILTAVPVVTCMFGYMFTAQFFSLAILFAVLGAYLVLKKERWYFWLTGIVLMTASIGIYQAYIPLILSVFLFAVIMLFAEADTDEKRRLAFKKTGISLICGISSLVLYYILMKFFLRINGLQLSSYKGMNAADSTPLSVYFSRIIWAYREFFLPTRGAIYDVFPAVSSVLYQVFVCAGLLLFGICTVRTFRKSAAAGVITLILGLLVPFCVNFIFIMVDRYNCYAMMVYSEAIGFVFFVWMFEKVIRLASPVFKKITQTAVVFGMIVMVFVFCRYDNACYIRAEMLQTQNIRYYASLVTRMQSTTGYDPGMRVAYIGTPYLVRWDPNVPERSELDYINTDPYKRLSQTIDGPWRNFMEYWFDFKPREVDISTVIDLPEVAEMPQYPAEGSIKVIDDILVVKFMSDLE